MAPTKKFALAVTLLLALVAAPSVLAAPVPGSSSALAAAASMPFDKRSSVPVAQGDATEDEIDAADIEDGLAKRSPDEFTACTADQDPEAGDCTTQSKGYTAPIADATKVKRSSVPVAEGDATEDEIDAADVEDGLAKRSPDEFTACTADQDPEAGDCTTQSKGFTAPIADATKVKRSSVPVAQGDATEDEIDAADIEDGLAKRSPDEFTACTADQDPEAGDCTTQSKGYTAPIADATKVKRDFTDAEVAAAEAAEAAEDDDESGVADFADAAGDDAENDGDDDDE